MFYTIAVLAVMTLQCVMLIGHYFLHFTGKPVKLFIECISKKAYAMQFLCSVLNCTAVLQSDVITPILKVSIWCNIAVVSFIVLPVLYDVLNGYREEFKKYKEY